VRRGYPWGYPQGEHVQTLGVSGLTSDYMNPIIGTNSKASTFQRGLAFFFFSSEVPVNTRFFVLERTVNTSNSLNQMGVLLGGSWDRVSLSIFGKKLKRLKA